MHHGKVTPAYDAFLLLSFGGPEGPRDVLPFLENVTRGRGIAQDRLLEVAEHYYELGRSPLNAANQALLQAVKAEFAAHSLDLPVYWGNRNWQPYVSDVVRQMQRDGVRRAVAFVTSAYSSYSACRQYLEDLEWARQKVGPGAPAITKLRHFFNHPGFIEANAEHVRMALKSLPELHPAQIRLVYTAHSIPLTMALDSGPHGNLYGTQLNEVARLVTAMAAPGYAYDLVWQSRSVSSQAWLEPDINQHLETLPEQGVCAVVVAPVGFISDHVEVLWDLDQEAAQTADKLGLGFARARTAGTHPAFVAAIRELVEERIIGTPARTAGQMGICGHECPTLCCRPSG